MDGSMDNKIGEMPNEVTDDIRYDEIIYYNAGNMNLLDVEVYNEYLKREERIEAYWLKMVLGGASSRICIKEHKGIRVRFNRPYLHIYSEIRGHEVEFKYFFKKEKNIDINGMVGKALLQLVRDDLSEQVGPYEMCSDRIIKAVQAVTVTALRLGIHYFCKYGGDISKILTGDNIPLYYEKRLSELRDELCVLREENRRLEKERNELRQEIWQFNRKLGEEQNKFRQEIEQLGQKFEKEQYKLQQEIEQLRKPQENLERELSTRIYNEIIAREKEKSKAEVNALIADNEALKEENEHLKGRVRELEELLEDERGNHKKGSRKKDARAKKEAFEYEKKINERDEKITKLEADVKEMKEERDAWYQKCLVEQEHRMKIERQLRGEIRMLKSIAGISEGELTATEEMEALSAPETNTVYEELRSVASGYKICVIGGHIGWQNRLRQLVPDITILENENFGKGKLNNVDVLVINTEFISHSATIKATSLTRDAGGECLLMSGSNLNLMLRKIKKLLEG